MTLKKKFECILCGSNNYRILLKLPKSPLANNLDCRSMEIYPLDIAVCSSCLHVQLLDIIDPTLLFKEYPYISRTGEEAVLRFESLARELDCIFPDLEEKFVLEIGSNDGHLLVEMAKLGWKTLGVDPSSNAADIAKQKGIETICNFFDFELGRDIFRKYDKPDLIVANNVLAHTNQMFDIFRAFKILMKQNSILVVEFSYLGDVIKNTLFDTIYHEHMSYHSLESFSVFLRNFEMEIFHIVPFQAHGGSLRLFITNLIAKRKIEPSVNQAMTKELTLRLKDEKSWVRFQERIISLENNIKKVLVDLKSRSSSVAAYGISAKFTTMFYGLKLDIRDFTGFYDDNSLKIGRCVPGTNLKIRSSLELQKDPVDYIFLFAWNYSTSLCRKIAKLGMAKKGIVIPAPKLQVISIAEASSL